MKTKVPMMEILNVGGAKVYLGTAGYTWARTSTEIHFGVNKSELVLTYEPDSIAGPFSLTYFSLNLK